MKDDIIDHTTQYNQIIEELICKLGERRYKEHATIIDFIETRSILMHNGLNKIQRLMDELRVR